MCCFSSLVICYNGLSARSDSTTYCFGMCITSLDFHLDRGGFDRSVGVDGDEDLFWNEA